MRLDMPTYPISFWNVVHMDKIENTPAARVCDWKDLGVTLAMSPRFDTDYISTAKAYLDECEIIKPIYLRQKLHKRAVKILENTK